VLGGIGQGESGQRRGLSEASGVLSSAIDMS
jgi:hypothetical protein